MRNSKIWHGPQCIYGPASRRFLAAIASSFFLFFHPSPGLASSITWTNAVGGNWNIAANWSPNQVPGISDTAWITNNGNYTVTVSDAEAVNVLSLGGTSGTQTLNLSSGAFTLGGSGAGNDHSAFTVSGGTFTCNGTATLNVLNFSSGTIQGSSPVQVSGNFAWTGGSMFNAVQFTNG